MREDEAAAAACGIPVARTKLLAYGTGAALGGVAGAFIASYVAVVSPDQFRFSFSVFIVSMVVLGGLGSIRGAIAGAVVVSAINGYLLPDVLGALPRRLGLDFGFADIASGVYGAIIVLVILLRPQGLVAGAGAPGSRVSG